MLEMESATMHLHVVGVLVLDPVETASSVDLDRLGELFAQRIHLIPPFRKRLVVVPGGMDHPRWIEEPDLDLAHHLHHRDLGPGATRGDLEAFVGEVGSVPLDRSRPLWEAWLVDGFADGTVALVTKLHHALMDGGAGTDMMGSLLDLEPDPHAGDPPEGDESAERDVGELPPTVTRLLLEAGPAAVRRGLGVPGVLARTVRGLAGSAREMAAAPGSIASLAPSSLFNGSLTAARSVAFRQCPLDDLNEVRTAHGTTVNDVVLAATTISLRDYLLERDALPSAPLVASVPTAGASSGRRQSDGYGNHTSNLMVSLPVHVDDPAEILMTVHAAMVGAKAARHAMEPEVLDGLVSLMPPWMLTAGARTYADLGLGRFHPPLFNAIVSNVAGPPVPLYLAGARVKAIFPNGPLIGNTGLNLTVLSQTGVLDLGVIACPDLVEDVPAIADGFLAGVDALRRATR